MRPASSLWSQSCSPKPLCRQSMRYFSSPVQSTSSNQTWSWPLPKKDLYLAATAVPQFNSRHVTATSCMPHLSSQTVPHIPSWKISTRPEHRSVPFTSRSCLLSIKWIKYTSRQTERCLKDGIKLVASQVRINKDIPEQKTEASVHLSLNSWIAHCEMEVSFPVQVILTPFRVELAPRVGKMGWTTGEPQFISRHTTAACSLPQSLLHVRFQWPSW